MQVAALGVMTELAGGAQAGLLGCGWPAVLRTLSNLAALQVGAFCKGNSPWC